MPSKAIPRQRDIEHHDKLNVLAERYRSTRSFTEVLCAPLETEDYVAQSMPDASPAKWHLAHTTWFFETFVLKAAVASYKPVDPYYEFIFNSYYNTVGEQYPRSRRGLLTRPTVEDVYRYRRRVDEVLIQLLERNGSSAVAVADTIELGLHHEQQHQELILTDVKHLLALNPLRPAYAATKTAAHGSVAPLGWRAYEGGVREIGHDGAGFAFDNEGPRHRVYLEPFALASRLVTNSEFLEFIADNGYRRPELWLSEGWETVRAQGWTAPLYWSHEGEHEMFTLAGMRCIEPSEPVCHLSYYEADAFARWAKARLPREAEWEVAAVEANVDGNFVESGLLHPARARDGVSPTQLFGDVWEWTQSSYEPYPGYRPPAGALGEYNGKFMCNQLVLRGGSCATSTSHIRATYRNFFPSSARWQFSGLRLALDLK